MKKPLLLLIKDGWGIGPDYAGNAVKKAKTPNTDIFSSKYPTCTLGASGEAVGVRAGSQGSSEVGHLNMGAGRIVEQEVIRVDKAIRSGSFFENERLVDAASNCKKNNSKFHIMGLVQDQGVHATDEHLFALLKFAKMHKLKKVYVHFFADGRDTAPRSALDYLEKLEKKISEYGVGEVASVIGRYYAMDRVNNWERTECAYNALVHGDGLRVFSAKEAIKNAYTRADKLLENIDKGVVNEGALVENDEFIQASIVIDKDGKYPGMIEAGDSVVHFNYRQDRAIQLTKAFVEDNFNGFARGNKPDVSYVGLTSYYDDFPFPVIPPMDMSNILGEVLSGLGLWQLRIAEFQKFKHVTSFFNGKIIKPFPYEDRIEAKSISIPEDQKPEMSAYEVTRLALCAIEQGIAKVRSLAADVDGVHLDKNSATSPAERFEDTYDFIVLNYANCDMVGHTGVFAAAVRAVETVDECVGKLVDAVLKRGGTVLITADHGNAEQMTDPKTGKVKTSHTLEDVEFALVSNNADRYELRQRGVLADIAPTVLELLGIDKPAEMTAESLIKNTA